ncbi:MAG: hypothetical protein OXH75_06000 [Acidobacteria bacterium]|nr:hypothetical protein [Acidobacteriota bacterium]
MNGDGWTDFAVPSWIFGPDDRDNTRDGFTLIATVLNTTRPGPVRCD